MLNHDTSVPPFCSLFFRRPRPIKMPRRTHKSRSYSWDSSRYDRAWDNYYDQLEEEERDWEAYYAEVEEQQRRAKVVPPLPRAPIVSAWRYEVTFLRRKIDDVERAVGTEAKVEQMRQMFTALQDFKAFLAATPKFRGAILKKMEELRKEPKAATLSELFDQTNDMFSKLAGRTDYVA
jgi:hypothetical protein